jgi:hypothetical protein
MLVHSQRLVVVHHISEVLPEVDTQDPERAKTIAWADDNPVVWKIVTGARSKAFGRNSCEYIGWAQRSEAPEAILERARHFHTCVDPNVLGGLEYRSRDIWGWRARFTFQHYQDKGFTGGYFQRFDGRYDRDCLSLDYTPGTLAEVVRNFMEWGHVDIGLSSTDVVKLDRRILPAALLVQAKRLRCTIWEDPATSPKTDPPEKGAQAPSGEDLVTGTLPSLM